MQIINETLEDHNIVRTTYELNVKKFKTMFSNYDEKTWSIDKHGIYDENKKLVISIKDLNKHNLFQLK